VLVKMKLGDVTVGGAARAQANMILLNIALTYLALRAQGKGGGAKQVLDPLVQSPPPPLVRQVGGMAGDLISMEPV
jgi:hypothetical protein